MQKYNKIAPGNWKYVKLHTFLPLSEVADMSSI